MARLSKKRRKRKGQRAQPNQTPVQNKTTDGDQIIKAGVEALRKMTQQAR